MKPRERKPQAQTSRMYLRKKDHRDCIYNDIYHNAIWMNKTEEDGETTDKLVWLKYPQRCLYMYMRYNETGAYPTIMPGWFDLDREWFCGRSWNGHSSDNVCKLKDYVVMTKKSTTDTVSVRITKDGCIHKTWSYTGGTGIREYKDNQFILFDFGSSVPVRSMTWRVFTINEFSIENIDISYDEYSYTFDADKRFSGSCYVLGRSGNGCLIYMTIQSTTTVEGYVYEVRDNGEVVEMYHDYPTVNNQPKLVGNAMTKQIIFDGKHWLLNVFSEKYPNASEYDKRVCLQTSWDGRNWTVHTNMVFAGRLGSSTTPDAWFCVRNEKLYVYISYIGMDGERQMKVFRCAKGSDILVDITPTTNYILMPIKKNCGYATMTEPTKEYVRLDLRSDIEASDEYPNYKLYSLLDSNISEGWGGIEFKDGELCDEVEEDVIVVSSNSGWNGRTIYFCIDAELTPNIDNFAWVSDQASKSDAKEKLMDGDYCYKGGTIESEVEE